MKLVCITVTSLTLVPEAGGRTWTHRKISHFVSSAEPQLSPLPVVLAEGGSGELLTASMMSSYHTHSPTYSGCSVGLVNDWNGVRWTFAESQKVAESDFGFYPSALADATQRPPLTDATGNKSNKDVDKGVFRARVRRATGHFRLQRLKCDAFNLVLSLSGRVWSFWNPNQNVSHSKELWSDRQTDGRMTYSCINCVTS